VSEIYFISYADDNPLSYASPRKRERKGGGFTRIQKSRVATAVTHGIRNIEAWTRERLVQTNIYKDHSDYLDLPISGNGGYRSNGFAFKPLVVLDLLKRVKEGDIVYYHDVKGPALRQPVTPIAELCRENDSFFVRQPVRNCFWTKRDAFFYMNCDAYQYHMSPQLVAGWFFIKRTDRNVAFVEEWLKYNLDERIASSEPVSHCQLPNAEGFVDHREDQSILTILAVKHRLRIFKGPGQSDINKSIDYVLSHSDATLMSDDWIKKNPERVVGTPWLGSHGA